MVKDIDYVQSKIKHCKKILGINAVINPTTGGCQPDHMKAESEEREKRYAALAKARLRKQENEGKIEHYD